MGTLLGFLRQTESEVYIIQKNFIFTIFGEIIKVYKTRNIKKIQKVLEIAKESLERGWIKMKQLNVAKFLRSEKSEKLTRFYKYLC
ncbi:hypothetical protein HYD98_00445 [Mycoplasmopsis bovis]|nr:hypothetical protein [Mycoplasmopsis bovis]QQH29138.1 hypothetical protein HYD98_00445 [Mycoplasmopsis bovis]